MTKILPKVISQTAFNVKFDFIHPALGGVNDRVVQNDDVLLYICIKSVIIRHIVGISINMLLFGQLYLVQCVIYTSVGNYSVQMSNLLIVLHQ